MGLALTVDSLDQVAEGVRNLYIEKNGKFVLDVDGVEDVSGLKNALSAERANNKTLAKTVKEMQDKYNGIDADAVRSMMAKAEDDKEAQLIASGRIDEVLQMRLARHNDKTTQEITRRDARIKSLSEKAIERELLAVAAAAGVHKTAVEDVILRGLRIFSIDETGAVVQLGEDGKPVLGADGKSPFNPAEWVETMRPNAPHWFIDGNAGGGGNGGNGTTGAKQLKRAEFDKLDPHSRAKHFREGGTVVD